MKLTLKFLVFWLSAITLYNCSSQDEGSETEAIPISTSINKIMPLGASRVAGARPSYESFRYELWKDLIENNWTFDFIGTQSDPASYPEFNSSRFDIDHEGRGGWTSGEILNNLNGWLNQIGSPDIVLFSSPGGNDGLEGMSYEQAVSNINSIINTLQSNNPNVSIIIEQMAPGRTDIMTPELTNYFERMQQEVLNISENQTTSSSKVIAVDMFTGFNDTFLADEVHYNELGATFIATRYYNTLSNILQQ